MQIDINTLDTVYKEYIHNANDLFTQLTEVLQRWDGTREINNGSFSEYQMQKIYSMGLFEMDPIRKLISDKFDGLEISLKKTISSLEDIKGQDIEDECLDFIDRYTTGLRTIHSSTVIMKNNYFKTDALKYTPETKGLETALDEMFKLEKDIRMMEIIYENIFYDNTKLINNMN